MKTITCEICTVRGKALAALNKKGKGSLILLETMRDDFKKQLRSFECPNKTCKLVAIAKKTEGYVTENSYMTDNFMLGSVSVEGGHTHFCDNCKETFPKKGTVFKGDYIYGTLDADEKSTFKRVGNEWIPATNPYNGAAPQELSVTEPAPVN